MKLFTVYHATHRKQFLVLRFEKLLGLYVWAVNGAAIATKAPVQQAGWLLDM